ncbi:MFS transporter [Microbacterium ulmi]|uniref:MFS transporter n=1 Tax=Microbacterium ulmi TaxID=179095 RepID=A0A7Y2Q0L1_9MICO|nr:MFS transporter [Microbacterium ulmi]NII68498.1 putative MFS family arabinose efflux permease [Microbacterium ulmi]NNH02980.1 MFS transporter [Microbacterium ulmi]
MLHPTTVLTFAIFWSTLDRSLILPLVPTIARDLGATVPGAATAITLQALAYSLLQILWGPLSTRWGRVRVLWLSTAIAAAANVGSALAPDLTWFLIARTASGGAFAATFAAVLTYFGDTLPLERRPAAMSNLATATALALGFGTLVSGAIVTAVSWRSIFGGFAVVTIAMAWAISRLPDAADRHEERVLVQLRLLLRNRWGLGVCALVAVEGLLLIGVYNLLPVALQQEGEDVFVSGLVTSVFGVAVVVVSQVMKSVITRIPPAAFIAVGGACAVAAFTVLATGVSPVAVLVGAGLMGTSWALAHTTLQTWMTDAAAATRALGMTLFSISLMLGGAAGAALGSVAVGLDAFPTLFVASIAVSSGFAIAGTISRARYTVRGG